MLKIQEKKQQLIQQVRLSPVRFQVDEDLGAKILSMQAFSGNKNAPKRQAKIGAFRALVSRSFSCGDFHRQRAHPICRVHAQSSRISQAFSISRFETCEWQEASGVDFRSTNEAGAGGGRSMRGLLRYLCGRSVNVGFLRQAHTMRMAVREAVLMTTWTLRTPRVIDFLYARCCLHCNCRSSLHGKARMRARSAKNELSPQVECEVPTVQMLQCQGERYRTDSSKLLLAGLAVFDLEELDLRRVRRDGMDSRMISLRDGARNRMGIRTSKTSVAPASVETEIVSTVHYEQDETGASRKAASRGRRNERTTRDDAAGAARAVAEVCGDSESCAGGTE